MQRARATLEVRFPAGEPNRTSPPDERQRDLLERYVRAWEASDIDGFVALLRQDAVLSMPPFEQWYRGRDAIRTFFTWVWQLRNHSGIRIVPTAANRQPAFVQYFKDPEGSAFVAHSLQVVTLHDDAIAAITVFLNRELVPAFGLPTTLPVA